MYVIILQLKLKIKSGQILQFANMVQIEEFQSAFVNSALTALILNMGYNWNGSLLIFGFEI